MANVISVDFTATFDASAFEKGFGLVIASANKAGGSIATGLAFDTAPALAKIKVISDGLEGLKAQVQAIRETKIGFMIEHNINKELVDNLRGLKELLKGGFPKDITRTFTITANVDVQKLKDLQPYLPVLQALKDINSKTIKIGADTTGLDKAAKKIQEVTQPSPNPASKNNPNSYPRDLKSERNQELFLQKEIERSNRRIQRAKEEDRVAQMYADKASLRDKNQAQSARPTISRGDNENSGRFKGTMDEYNAHIKQQNALGEAAKARNQSLNKSITDDTVKQTKIRADAVVRTTVASGEEAKTGFLSKMKGIVDGIQVTGQQGQSIFSTFFKASYFADLTAGITTGLINSLKAVTVESVLYAARTEELAVTLDSLAKVNHLSTRAITEQEVAIKRLNITTQDSQETIAKFINVGFDISKSSPLARVAQDLAVIGNKNTSEELNALTIAIQTLQSRNLRSAGVFITVDQVLDKLSATTGRARDSFSTLEKQQAVLSAVLDYGSRVAGTYESAMGTVSKQMRSLPRLFSEAQNAVGTSFIPALGGAVSVAGSLLTAVAKYPDIFKGAIYSVGLFTASLIILKTQLISGIGASLAGLVNSAKSLSNSVGNTTFVTTESLANAERAKGLVLEQTKLEIKLAQLSLESKQLNTLIGERAVNQQIVSINQVQIEQGKLKLINQERMAIADKLTANRNIIQNGGALPLSTGDKFTAVAGKIALVGTAAVIAFQALKAVKDLAEAPYDIQSLDTSAALRNAEDLKEIEKDKIELTRISNIQGDIGFTNDQKLLEIHDNLSVGLQAELQLRKRNLAVQGESQRLAEDELKVLGERKESLVEQKKSKTDQAVSNFEKAGKNYDTEIEKLSVVNDALTKARNAVNKGYSENYIEKNSPALVTIGQSLSYVAQSALSEGTTDKFYAGNIAANDDSIAAKNKDYLEKRATERGKSASEFQAVLKSTVSDLDNLKTSYGELSTEKFIKDFKGVGEVVERNGETFTIYGEKVDKTSEAYKKNQREANVLIETYQQLQKEAVRAANASAKVITDSTLGGDLRVAAQNYESQRKTYIENIQAEIGKDGLNTDEGKTKLKERTRIYDVGFANPEVLKERKEKLAGVITTEQQRKYVRDGSYSSTEDIAKQIQEAKAKALDVIQNGQVDANGKETPFKDLSKDIQDSYTGTVNLVDGMGHLQDVLEFNSISARNNETALIGMTKALSDARVASKLFYNESAKDIGQNAQARQIQRGLQLGNSYEDTAGQVGVSAETVSKVKAYAQNLSPEKQEEFYKSENRFVNGLKKVKDIKDQISDVQAESDNSALHQQEKQLEIVQAQENLRKARDPNIEATRINAETSLVNSQQKLAQLQNPDAQTKAFQEQQKLVDASIKLEEARNAQKDAQNPELRRLATETKIVETETQLWELKQKKDPRLAALERQLKVEQGILSFKDQQKNIEDEIAILKVTSTLPAINAELLAQKAILQSVVDRKQAEQQLTADIAVELYKRNDLATNLSRNTQQAYANVFLEQLKADNQSVTDAQTSQAKYDLATNNTAGFENNDFIQNAIKSTDTLGLIKDKADIQIEHQKRAADALEGNISGKLEDGNRASFETNNRVSAFKGEVNGNFKALEGEFSGSFKALEGKMVELINAQQSSQANFSAPTGGGSANTSQEMVIKTLINEAQRRGITNKNVILSLLGDVYRENGFNANTILKGHSDPANNAYNFGYISAQGVRGTDEARILKNNGADVGAGGNFAVTEKNLRLAAYSMFEDFAKHRPSVYKNFFNPNSSTLEASKNNKAGINYVIGYDAKSNRSYNTVSDPNFLVGENAKGARIAAPYLGASIPNISRQTISASQVIIDKGAEKIRQDKKLTEIKQAEEKIKTEENNKILAIKKANERKMDFINRSNINLSELTGNTNFSDVTFGTDEETALTKIRDEETKRINDRKAAQLDFQLKYSNPKVIAARLAEQTSDRRQDYSRSITERQNDGLNKLKGDTEEALNEVLGLYTKNSIQVQEVQEAFNKSRIESIGEIQKQSISLDNEETFRKERNTIYLASLIQKNNNDIRTQAQQLEEEEANFFIKASNRSAIAVNLKRQEILVRRQAAESVQDEIDAQERYNEFYLGSVTHVRDLEKQGQLERIKAHADAVTQILKLEESAGKEQEGMQERLKLKYLQVNEARRREYEDTLSKQIDLEASIARKDEAPDKTALQQQREKLLGTVNDMKKSSADQIGDFYNDTFKAISSGTDSLVDKMTAKLGIAGGAIGSFMKAAINRPLSNIFGKLTEKLFPRDSATLDAANGLDVRNGKEEVIDSQVEANLSLVGTVKLLDSAMRELIGNLNGSGEGVTTVAKGLSGFLPQVGGLSASIGAITSGNLGILGTAISVTDQLYEYLPKFGGGNASGTTQRRPNGIATTLGQGQSRIGSQISGIQSTVSQNSGTSGGNGFGTGFFGASQQADLSSGVSSAGTGARGSVSNTMRSPKLNIGAATPNGRGGYSLEGVSNEGLAQLSMQRATPGFGSQLAGAGVGIGTSVLGNYISGLGGTSKAGGILGAASSGILGIGGAAVGSVLATGGIAGLGTALSSTSGLLAVGGLTGAATLGIGLAVVGALALGAYLLGRSKRRKEEKIAVTKLSGDSITKLQDLLKGVKSDKIDGDSAIQQAQEIRNQFTEEAKKLKTKPAKRAAEQTAAQMDGIIGQIRVAATEQTRRKEISAKIIPTYAQGGVSDSSLIRVSRGEELIYPTQTGVRSYKIPGTFDGRDNILARVPIGTEIRNPFQQIKNLQSFAKGGLVTGVNNNNSSVAPAVVNFSPQMVVAIGDAEIAKIIATRPDIVYNIVRNSAQADGMGGLSGDVASTIAGSR